MNQNVKKLFKAKTSISDVILNKLQENGNLSFSDSFLTPYSNLKLAERLGESAYGIVFKATKGYETVAVKH